MSDTPETPITPGPPTPINGVPAQPAAGSPTPPAAPTAPIPPYVAPAAQPAPTSQQAEQPAAAPTDGAQLPPAADTEPIAPLASESPAPVSTTRQRSTATIVVVALVVGAVIGGVSGAGVTLLTNHNSGSSTSATVDPTTINVNNPADATTVTAVAAKASPSVVTINVTTSSEGGTGSGVVLTSDGYILTNTHVVTLDGESSDGTIKVTLNDGRIFSGKLIGTDPVSDLAVVKIATTGLTPATFADSSKLNVGDSAIAIGAPLGLSGTVTTGIVSALNRSITIASSAVPDDQSSSQDGDSSGGNLFGFDFPGQGGSSSTTTQSTATISLAVVQTDAAINPGNSGGALLNDKGQVIGINVAIASASDSSTTSGTQSGSIGVGFSIPSDLAQRVAKELMASGKATHGLLGASIVNDESSDGTTTTTTSQSVAGAVVNAVTAGSAAEKAGLKKGDIITKFNGLPITDYTDLIAQVRAEAAGATSTLTYVRDGKAFDASVTLGTLK
jgi:putative serine protease PepD